MSWIEINLLPDVRLNRLKEQHMRKLASTAMILVASVCGGLLLLGWVITQGENLRIQSLTHDIVNKQKQISSTPHLSDILTTQQGLTSLAELYQHRVYLSTFFGILQKISPKDVSISSLTLAEGNVITISGKAKDYLTASRLARAMEVSGVSIDRDNSPSAQNEFTGVELSGLTSSQAGQVAFTIKAVAHSRVTNGIN